MSDTEELKELEILRPSLEHYNRIDLTYLPQYDNHVIHETLNGKSKIEAYEIYKHIENDEILCVIKFGNKINGHKGI